MFNAKQIKNINITLNNVTWNPLVNSIVLEYDAKSPMGFGVKFVPIYPNDTELHNLDLAKETLKKYTK